MPRNVILLSLDTLRADVAFSRKLPAVEFLRRRGTSFLQTVSSSPLTPVSHATVLTGRQPPGTGIRHLFREKLRAGVPTLASVLREAGYATVAVVSSPGLNHWYGLNQGFDWYDDDLPRLADGRDALHVPDVKLRGTALKRAPTVVDRVLDRLPAPRSLPLFLFVHFFDAHWPYEAPEDVGVDIANPYEGEVAFMDHYLGVLLERLDAAGWALKDAILVLLSDHGEDLAGWYPDDHAGDCGHPEEQGHGCLLYDVTQLVPLVVCADGAVPAGASLSMQTRLVDVAPTVLDLVGLPHQAMDGVDGVSLVPFLDGQSARSLPAYCETYYPEEKAMAEPEFGQLKPLKAIRLDDGNSGRRKIIWQVGGDRVEVYDLAADSAERHAYAFGYPIAADAMATDPVGS